MEDSNYFLKTLGLETFINHESLPRIGINNMEFNALESKIQGEKPNDNDNTSQTNTCEKQEVAYEDSGQVATHVQADDFFSSLELQSSSKTSSNMTALSFSNKPYGGIVTRSRSYASALYETNKLVDKKFSNLKARKINKSEVKKKKKGKACLKRKIKSKGKALKVECGKKIFPDSKDKNNAFSDAKKPNSNKLNENIAEKGLVIDKNKEEDDWVFFGHLNSKKDTEDKVFENKQNLINDMQNPVRRCTPEFFSMNSILMSDTMSEGKDEVDKLLDVDDYDDSFLEEMEDFNYAPPRSHTGGKWKPGSLSVRTSPMFWQSQNWDALLDDEERKNRIETPMDPLELPGEKNKLLSISSTGGKLKCCIPPPTHTGGKWKPLTPPATHTGGKWKPLTPPASYTGGKWNPLETGKPKKCDQDLISSDDGSHNWKFEDETELPITHAGGKWKPGLNHSTELWKTGSAEATLPSNHTGGKWISEKSPVTRSTLDFLANCQSTPGKCLKTAGGMIQYYCSPCNRRLSSKKMYKKHIQSELHFKRVLQENELEFDSRSIKLFHGLFTQGNYKERDIGKRVIKKPEIFQDTSSSKKERNISGAVKVRKKKTGRRETIRCEVCKIKIPRYQLGKHLVSYYHSRRIKLNDPNQQKLILDNIHIIVKQAPYQCGICKFYCNTHKLFKKHWALDIHKEMEKEKHRRFWCALCNFECETSRSMELHLDSNSHREVMLAVNKSIPIIIRQKVIFNCRLCFKEFRSNRELISHEHSFHQITEGNTSNKLVCSICQQNCKSLKSLQRHILNSHKDASKLLYFCTTCNEFFNSAEEAKNHRKSEIHKSKASLEENNVRKNLSRPCYFCGKTLDNISKLKIHLFENHSGFLPKCIKCGEVFALSQEVSRHIKNNKCNFAQKASQTSQLAGSFSCEKCSFSTNLKSEYLLHVAVHEKKPDEKKISCPLCKSNFTQAALALHLKSHLKEMTYKCSLCSVTFMRKDRYVRHLKLKHFDKEDLDSSYCKEAKEITEAPTESKDQVRDPVKKVVGEELEKKCDIKTEKRKNCGDPKCKYIAKDLDDFESHRLFHVAPKTYQCPECPYTAKTNTIIKRHYLTHIDERSFPCNFCPFKARLKSHLKRHMRLHTGAKPFKCPHCTYTCNNLENLRKHVLYTKIHPEKKLYECKFCDFDTNVSKEFKIHLSNNHKNDCKPLETNEAAGIYRKEEDLENALTPVPAKARVFTAKPKTAYSTGIEKKTKMITQLFSSIAPKSQFADEKYISPTGNLKMMGNSIEDKRKILKMELEKLKSQIKPAVKKDLKPYPSPAEKEWKMKMCPELNKSQTTAIKRNLSKADATNVDATCTLRSDAENGVLLLNVLPSTVEKTPLKPTKNNDVTVQHMEFSSTYILYENVLPSEEMELCLMEDYQV